MALGQGPSTIGRTGPVKVHLSGGRRPPSLSITEEVRHEELDHAEHYAGLCPWMAAVALRAAARRPEPRSASWAGSAPITVRTPGPPAGLPVPLSRCRTSFTSCTPMGAMLLARSATASTGRSKASSEPQPEPLILVSWSRTSQRPAPRLTAHTRPSTVGSTPLSCPSPVASPGPAPPGQPRRASRCRKALLRTSANPRRRHTSPVARRQSGRRPSCCAALSVAGSGAMRTHSASALTMQVSGRGVFAYLCACLHCPTVWREPVRFAVGAAGAPSADSARAAVKRNGWRGTARHSRDRAWLPRRARRRSRDLHSPDSTPG